MRVTPDTLTDRERAVFEQLYETTKRQGYQPDLRELAAAMGWTGWSAVQRCLDMIRAKGWIDAQQRAGRSIRFLYQPDGTPFKGFKDRKLARPVA